MSETVTAYQVGGNHYSKHKIQPWHIIEECNLDFWEGNIIKYIVRRKGDRLTELKKAKHYLEYLIRRESTSQLNNAESTAP